MGRGRPGQDPCALVSGRAPRARPRSVRCTAADHADPPLRPSRRYYYQNTDALIYIVDSADPSRFEEARNELHRVLSDDELRGAVVLVLANKQDMLHSVEASKVADAMGLRSLSRHNWYIQGCSAQTGEGLFEGLDWLHSALRARKQ